MAWREDLIAYLRAQLPSADEVSIGRLTTMPAGASNDTVGLDLDVTCDGQRFSLPLVLRPQRPDGILAPYDVGRQFQVMRALANSAVPVPAVLWHEEQGEVLGAPFFMMERVHGETLPLFWYGANPRLLAAAEMLATIHAVDWQTKGMRFLAPPGNELPAPTACELANWRDRAEGFRIGRAPMLVGLADYLEKNEPSDSRHALLHGDPNPGNYLFRGDRVVTVLDWELAAIGDPRSDLGFYAALLTVFGGMGGAADGRTLLSEAYEQVTGTRLHDLEYYEAFGLYRMMIVLTGWGGRIGGFSRYGMDAISRRLVSLIGDAWEQG